MKKLAFFLYFICWVISSVTLPTSSISYELPNLKLEHNLDLGKRINVHIVPFADDIPFLKFASGNWIENDRYLFPSIPPNEGEMNEFILFPNLASGIDFIRIGRANGEVKLMSSVVFSLYPTYHFLDQTIYLSSNDSLYRFESMSSYYTAKYSELREEKKLSFLSNNQPFPIISGGIELNGWVLNDNSSDIWQVSVPPGVDANQLFVNGDRSRRSRLPPVDYYHYDQSLNDSMARYGFVYAEGQVDNLVDLESSEFVVYHSWTTSRHHYSTHFKQNRTNPSDRVIGYFTAQAAKRYHIENVREGLISPGTFYFDRLSNQLYYWTFNKTDPNTLSTIIPILDTLMVIAGESMDNPIHDSIIAGISFQHTSWTVGPSEIADGQATSWLTTAAIYLSNGRNIAFDNITIEHSGGYSLWSAEGTSNIFIMNSIINDTGAGGLRVGTMGEINSVTNCSNVYISNNSISHGGQVFPSGVGILIHKANIVLVANNTVHTYFYTGISYGWVWGYASSNTGSIYIINNHIYNIGQHVLNDMGGIYSLGSLTGSIVAGNIIHTIYSFAMYDWGIYLDEGTSQVLVEGNIVYSTGSSGLFQHYGFNNTIINNIFSHGREFGLIAIGLPESHLSLSSYQNIFYDVYNQTTGPRQIFVMTGGPNTSIASDENIWYSVPKNELLFGNPAVNFSSWQNVFGQDRHSLIADPMFAQPEVCNFFDFTSKSVINQINFQPIPRPRYWREGCFELNKEERENREKRLEEQINKKEDNQYHSALPRYMIIQMERSIMENLENSKAYSGR